MVLSTFLKHLLEKHLYTQDSEIHERNRINPLNRILEKSTQLVS